LALYGTPDLGFRWDLHLWHHDDKANLSRLPRDDDGWRWRLVTSRRFGWSSMVAGAVLRLQEDDGELHSGVLDLLLAFNCGERRRKMARDDGS
jgi:hypothetical protein